MKNIFLTLSVLVFSFGFSQTNVFDIARKGTLQEMETLHKTNPDAINQVNEGGNSPLILACYKGNVEVAAFLIKNVKDINFNSPMGTALMAAIVKGNNEIASMLISKNANVNLSDGNKNTSLIYATQFKNYEIVSLLIKANANPDFKDNRNNSAIDYAILANDDKLMELLKNKNKKL